LDLCDSGEASEQEHFKFKLYPSSPSLAQYSYTSAAQYERLCARGPSDRHHLVRDDSFRTFRTADRDANQFLQAVPEAALVRVCDAFDHVYAPQGFEYCQGMNVYAGVFLYVLPELDAFNLFSLFCTQYIPLYWRANHIGAEAGCRTLDAVLARVDPTLSQRLLHAKPCELTGLIIAFAPVKTMSAIAPPLAQVLLLWDFLMAAGPHMSVLCVAAQIHHIRDKVITAEFPKDMLDYRKWPQLDARRIIRQALAFLSQLDARLLKDVMLHPVSDHAVHQLAGRRTYNRPGDANK
jgi:cell cycle arrest protein BUB2